MKREVALKYIRLQIRVARRVWKISKAELSRRTEVSVYLITKIERGENVDMHLILRLLPALYLRSEILIEVGLIDSFDDYYDDKRVQLIELDRPGGIFHGIDSSQIIVDWKNSANGID